MNSISARLLLTWLLCIVAGTLAPFSFSTEGVLEHGLKMFQYGAFERDPMHFGFNVLLFLPLGVLLHHEGRRRSIRVLPLLVLATTAGLLISTAIEYSQAFLPTRDSSLFDVLANTLGSCLGVAVGRSWGTAADACLVRARAMASSVVLAGLIGSCLALALVISGTLQARTRLGHWNPGYPLLVGNDRTGDRPWRGRVFSLDISDTATPAASVRRFSAGESVVPPGMPIAAFDFSGKPPYKDATGHLPDLQWTEPPKALGQVGVSLPGRPWLQSDRPAAGLAQRLRTTNGFTLLVRCATDDLSQQGPAGIVSNSVSPLLRNFTLGQRGGDLVFRMQKPVAGVDGYPLEVYVPGVFTNHDAREILATFDGATLLVAVAHDDDVSSLQLTPSSSVVLALPTLNVTPDELPLYELAYVAALSLLPAALIGFLAHTSRERWGLSVAWVLALAVLLQATIVVVSGSSFEWADVAKSVCVGALVLTAVNVILSNADVPPRRPVSSSADIARREALEHRRRSGISETTF